MLEDAYITFARKGIRPLISAHSPRTPQRALNERAYPRSMRRAPPRRRYLDAQARAVVGLAVAWSPPLLGSAVRRLTGEPRGEETVLDEVEATVFRPARGAGPWPAAVLFPGVTREGRRHAAFVGLGRGLAAAGHLAVVAEPSRLAAGELTGATAAQALAAARAVADRPDVAGGRIALVGVSGGATLALLTAAAEGLSGRVSAVVALAPVCDLEEALRFVTTGYRREDGRLVAFRSRGFFELVCARSVVASLPDGEDRDEALEHLRALPDYGEDPLGTLGSLLERATNPGVRATLELFASREPERFDDLVQQVPSEARDSLAALSVIRAAPRIEAPVEVVVAREDKYVPLEDALAFMRVCSAARLTILDSLQHAVPSLSLGDVRDLVRLDRALVRMLAASYSR
jgi:dienelactone hydrolase